MLEENKKDNIEQKSEEAPVKKKKLAVVFHSRKFGESQESSSGKNTIFRKS